MRALLAFLITALLAGPAFAQTSGAFQAQSAALASSLVVATGADRQLSSLDVEADATLAGAAWFVMVFDATSAPADGSVTPAFCWQQASGSVQFTRSFGQDGPRFQNGVVVVASTAGCFTKTASAHAFIAATYR